MGGLCSSQFKVWAFLPRNSQLLTHDEYRAGHVGFHCSNTRRLKDIRGYTVNIHDYNHGLSAVVADTDNFTVKNEPDGFLDLWDGFPEVYFDDRKSWTEAGKPEKTRATENGLEVDADWTLSDGPFLFDSSGLASPQFRSFHIRMHENVIIPVLRVEERPCKIIQFYKRSSDLSQDEFESIFFGEYALLCASQRGLSGLIFNSRDHDIDSAVDGYYPEGHWCFSEAGRRSRLDFFQLWDGANEMFFGNRDDFFGDRESLVCFSSGRIQEIERRIFDSIWYVEVDENVIVMPNRGDVPDFYYR